jgi:hypothetical protein
MSIRQSCGAIIVLATFGLGSAAGGGHVVAYYYPPCYSVPVYAGWSFAYPATYVYPAPLMMRPTVPLAVPTPAPPSKAVMPPAGKALHMSPATGPSVTEARSGTGAPLALAKDRCRVGFWNLSGRDVTIVVEGETRVLLRDRALTLELTRDFTWHIDQQADRSEHVGEDKSTYELVIR